MKRMFTVVAVSLLAMSIASLRAQAPSAGAVPPRAFVSAVEQPASESASVLVPFEPQPVHHRASARPEICITHQVFVATQRALGLDASCQTYGPCDDPTARNAAIPTATTPIKTIRLAINVFCENNGGNCAASATDVEVAVARLNTDFAPWRIQFVHQAYFINSTKFRYLVPATETGQMKIQYAKSPASMLNIYVVNTGNGVSWGTFPWSAAALDKQGGIVIHETWFRESSPLPAILTHEVGHCLGLWHTFHGVDEVDPCSACYEPAGRSPEIGDITGDFCSDTEATPKNTTNCADPAGNDPCSGNPWLNTPYNNYMGYGHTCQDHFTPQQAGRLHCWTANVLSGWLQLPMPPATPGSPSLSKIGGGQVQVSWADNSNDEQGFEVQREKKSGPNWNETTTVATVGANTTTIIDQPGSGTFRYRVRAFNALGYSAWSSWTQIKN